MGNVRGSDYLDARVIEINPQLAQDILKKAHKQRPVSQGHVADLANSMSPEVGEWCIAQPLLFDREDKMFDGQHPILGVIRSGQPQKFLVIKGFDASVIHAVDRVRVRSLADYLYMLGETNHHTKAKVIRMEARYDAGLMPTSTGGAFKLTTMQGIAFLESHPDIRISVDSAPGMVNTYLPRAMSCWCHYQFAKRDRTAADDFFVGLTMQDSAGPTDPVYLLRQRMISNRRAKSGGRMPQKEQCALTIKAWNAVRQNKPMAQLKWQWVNGERFPEIL